MEINMEKKSKGRPTKPALKRKRLQYSVWVSAEEKQQIDKLIEQANLPASQFFLTQVIEKPIQRPKKKTLPKAVMQQISILEKLAGVLSLAVLKTKDKDMIQSVNWQQSSQNIKWISELLSLFIFQDFDFPKLKINLQQIKEDAQKLYWFSEVGNKEDLQAMAGKIHHQSQELLAAFEKHYQEQNPVQRFELLWEEDIDIHQRIEQLKHDILEQ